MQYKADVDKDGVIHSIIEIEDDDKTEWHAMEGRFIKDITAEDVTNYNKWEYTKYEIKETTVNNEVVQTVAGKEEFKIEKEIL